MPALRVARAHPERLAGGDGVRDVVDVVPEETRRDENLVLERSPP